MRNKLKRYRKLLLFVPIPLGWWLLWAGLPEIPWQYDQHGYEWDWTFLVAILCQGMLLLPLTRRRARTAAALVVSVLAAVLFMLFGWNLAEVVYYKYYESVAPLVSVVGSVLLIWAMGYAGSLLLGSLTTPQLLHEMGMTGWRWMVPAGAIVLATLLMSLYLREYDAPAYAFLAIAGDVLLPVVLVLLVITVIATWKPAREWWRSPPLWRGLLADVLACLYLLYLAAILYEEYTALATIFGSALLSTGFVALVALATTGFRFVLSRISKKWLLFLPIPLGWWLLWSVLGGQDLYSYRWDPEWTLLVAILCQSVLLLPLTRHRGRTWAALVVPIVAAVLFALLIDYGLMEVIYYSRFHPASLIGSALVIWGMGYATSLLLCSLTTPGHLPEHGLTGWRWRVLAGGIVLVAIALSLLQFFSDYVDQPFLLAGGVILLVITVAATWKPAREWWRSPSLLRGLLADVLACIYLFYFAVILGIYDYAGDVFMVALFSPGLAALLALATAGLRFALAHLPRRQVLHDAGLLDWRGGLLLAILGLGVLLVVATPYVEASGSVLWGAMWPMACLLAAAAVTLYWQPAADWQQDRAPVYPFVATAILLALALVVAVVALAVTEGSWYESFIRVVLICLLAMVICTLVALLAWLRTLIGKARRFLEKPLVSEILAALGLGIFANRRSVLRAVLAALVLIVTWLLITYKLDWVDTDSAVGLSGQVWLCLLAGGWLAASLLPRRLEGWPALLWSGGLLLLWCAVFLPVLPPPSGMVSYNELPVLWAGREDLAWGGISWMSPLIPLVALLGLVLFAAVIRSGRAALTRSRKPKPEAMLVALMLLGPGLAMASSYSPAHEVSVQQKSGNLWTSPTLPQQVRGEVSHLVADGTGAIWLGTSQGGLARFDDDWQMPVPAKQSQNDGAVRAIYDDGHENVWVVWDKVLRGFDRASGELKDTQTLSDLGLEPGDSLYAIYRRGPDELWLGTSAGLRLRSDGWMPVPVSSASEGGVREIGGDEDGSLWFRTSSQVYVLATASGNEQALSLAPGSSLTYSLDLTDAGLGGLNLGTILASDWLHLSLLVQMNLDPDYESFELMAQTGEGGEDWDCLPPTSSAEDYMRRYGGRVEANCWIAAQSQVAFAIEYDLSEYVGGTVSIQMTRRLHDPDATPGSLHLLKARMKLPVYQTVLYVPIPLSIWPGRVEEVLIKDMTIFLPSGFQDGPSIWHRETEEDEGEVLYVWQGQSAQTVHAPAMYVDAIGSYVQWEVGNAPVVYRPTATELEAVELDGANPCEGDHTLYADGAGRLWLSCPGGPLVFTKNGQEWFDASEAGLRGNFHTPIAFARQNGTDWLAGQTGTGVNRRYAIAEYPSDGAATGARLHRVGPDLTHGRIEALVAGDEGVIWALLVDDSPASNSIWWFVLPVLCFVGLGYVEYYGQPATQAQRLRRRLEAEPEQALYTLYGLLTRANVAGEEILAELAAQPPPQGDGDWTGLAGSLIPVAPGHPLADPVTLLRLCDELEASDGVPGAQALGVFYRTLATALAVRAASQIASWPVRLLTGEAGTTPTLMYDNREPVDVPSFVDPRAMELLAGLEQVARYVAKHDQVDASRDRVEYLHDAERLAASLVQDAAVVNLPEGPYLEGIADSWHQIVRAEFNRVMGRAELRVELRTRQVRRSGQVTLALRVRNAGQALAEGVVVTLKPDDGFTPAGESEAVLERISSGDSHSIEFAIVPGDSETARIAGEVCWQDRLSPDNRERFADEVRFYETAEQFRPIPNPYNPGPPVRSPEMFHGREDLFRFIRDNLSGTAQGRTIVLHGQRRTGKTSILYQLLLGRLGEGFVPVLIDMQELALVRSTEEFLAEVALRIFRASERAGMITDEPELEAFDASPSRAFNHFLDRLEAALGAQRVVVMFDEFELIEGKIEDGSFDKNLLGYLRSLMQHHDSLLFIFTGTHKLEEMSHDYWSVFFNIALSQRISFLARADAERLIRDPVAGSLLLDALAVEKIIELTRGQPYFLQLVCWAVVNYCNAERRNYATLSDVNEVVQQILVSRAGDPYFAFIWAGATAAQRLALAGLAHTVGPGKAWARPSEILNTMIAAGDAKTQRSELVAMLDKLATEELLEVGAAGILRYRFQIELLRLWVAATKPMAAVVEREE